MSDNRKTASRARLREFFDEVYAPDSLAGGIITASRPNQSRDWDADAELELGRRTADAFVRESDAAAARMARR